MEKALLKLGRHERVQYRIQRRVQIEHDPREIKQTKVPLHTEIHDLLQRGEYHPHHHGAKRQQTDEEHENDGAEHAYNLLAVLHRGLGYLVLDARFLHELVDDDGVEDEEDDDRQDEEDEDGRGDVDDAPLGWRLRLADGDRRVMVVCVDLVGHQKEKRTVKIEE